MFSVGYGSVNREYRIARWIDEEDHTTAVILGAVHFEWMIKRSILKLGVSPTPALRKKLEDVYSLKDRGPKLGYKSIWEIEVKPRFRNAALGTVLGNLNDLGEKAMKVRGQVIHGNGTVKRTDARDAVMAFIAAGQKLRAFALAHEEDLDTRLKARLKPRTLK